MEFNLSKFNLLGDYLLVDVEEVGVERSGGLILPSGKKEHPTDGVIIKIGEGVKTTSIEEGDIVFFVAGSLQPVVVEDDKLMYKVPLTHIHGYVKHTNSNLIK
ncbi:MAG: co-chaperone GroES [Rickettsiales bacterium]|nr:MAG: co-chaperone GroES [Rickettsiales bacterium]